MHQVLPGFWCRRLEAAAVGICPVTAIGQLNPRQLAVLVLILPGSVIGGCARQPTIGVVKSDLAAIAGADPGGLPKAVVVNLNRVAMPVLNPTGQKIEMVTLQVVGQPLAITFQGPDQLGGGAIDGNIKIIMHAFAGGHAKAFTGQPALHGDAAKNVTLTTGQPIRIAGGREKYDAYKAPGGSRQHYILSKHTAPPN